jgi:hypothetical protein
MLPSACGGQVAPLRRRTLRRKATKSGSEFPPLRQAKAQPHTCRSTIMRLISAIAFAGFRCFGQALAQFMMVWQR